MQLVQRRMGLLLPVLVIVGIIGCDQWSKALVVDYFTQGGGPVAVTSFFNLVWVMNRGISFGFFSFTQPWGAWALSALAILVTCGLLWWLVRVKDRCLELSLALVIGGAIGNIMDRLRFHAVVDFLDFHWGTNHWPAFNVADSAICIGVAWLMWAQVFMKKGGKNGVQ